MNRRATAWAESALLGALAGVAGTALMTAAMARLHRLLPSDERYPLPPREITERALRTLSTRGSEDDLSAASLIAHYAYGALTGALLAFGPRVSSIRGGLYGVLVWGASYFGWAPATGILKPAHHHPLRRNLLMIAAHVVWGAATAWVIEDGRRARREAFGAGPLRDARP